MNSFERLVSLVQTDHDSLRKAVGNHVSIPGADDARFKDIVGHDGYFLVFTWSGDTKEDVEPLVNIDDRDLDSIYEAATA